MTRLKAIIQTQSSFALKSEPPGGAARLVEPSEQVSRACPASKLAPAEAESESLYRQRARAHHRRCRTECWPHSGSSALISARPLSHYRDCPRDAETATCLPAAREIDQIDNIEYPARGPLRMQERSMALVRCVFPLPVPPSSTMLCYCARKSA